MEIFLHMGYLFAEKGQDLFIVWQVPSQFLLCTCFISLKTPAADQIMVVPEPPVPFSIYVHWNRSDDRSNSESRKNVAHLGCSL